VPRKGMPDASIGSLILQECRMLCRKVSHWAWEFARKFVDEVLEARMAG